MWNMVSYIKGGMQAKGIWKQDPEANIWVQEEWEWGVEKLHNEELGVHFTQYNMGDKSTGLGVDSRTTL